MTDIHPVSAKTMQGASLMVVRTAAMYPIGFLGEVYLARLLDPQDFGVYDIVRFVPWTLAMVLELGLTAALVQRPEPPSRQELQAFFTLQVLVASALVLGLFLMAPQFLGWLQLDPAVRWILLTLVLCPWISGLGAMSCVRLDRTLRYGVFATMDVLRVISYVGIAVPLAYLGWGVWSLVVAIVASTLVRSAVALRASPWPVGFRLRFAGMARTLRTGFLFQGATLTSLFRDHIAVLLAGPLFGAQAVGYLNWAKNMTFYSSQFFTQAVSRVVFPSVSRIQTDPQAVRDMAHHTLKYVNLLTFPSILIFAALIPEFVEVVFTPKWAPAIPAFYLYSIRMLGSNISTLHISILNGLGQVRIALRILVWWTVLDWILALVLCQGFGFAGVAMAYAISIIPVALWLIVQLNRIVRIRLYPSLVFPLLASGAAATLVWAVKGWATPSWSSLAVLSVTGGTVYTALVGLSEGRSLLKDIRVFLSILVRREMAEIGRPGR